MGTGASSGRPGRRGSDVDEILLDAAREGCDRAFAELWLRHHAAATRMARRVVAPSDVDDVVSESFTKMLRALRRGGGPAHDVGSYLTTAVYRVALELDRRRALDAAVRPPADADPWALADERLVLTRALSELPARWRWILWHTEVEGAKPRELTGELGLQSNAVSALRRRARTGLREAWLSAHIGPAADAACRWTRGRLVAFTDGTLSASVARRLGGHVRSCAGCADAHAEVEAARRRVESGTSVAHGMR